MTAQQSRWHCFLLDQAASMMEGAAEDAAQKLHHALIDFSNRWVREGGGKGARGQSPSSSPRLLLGPPVKTPAQQSRQHTR
jgi:hypothetical protein